jgi:hypothetical protein
VAWTDDRIDDAMTRIDRGFESLRNEMREMRAEMRTELRELRGEMHTEFRAVRADLGAGQRQQAMIGWAIAGALLAQLVTFVITQS